MPYAKKLSEAVYLMSSIEDSYDYPDEYTNKDPTGLIKGEGGSIEYTRQIVPNIFSIVCEVSCFYDFRINDLRRPGVKRRDAVLYGVKLSNEMFSFLKKEYEAVQALLAMTSKFKEAIEETLRKISDHLEAKRKWAESVGELGDLATIAQQFDSYAITRFYGMLSFGMFIRMIDYQLQNTSLVEEKGELEETKRRVETELEKHNEKLLEELNYVIPIKRLVAVQLAAALTTVEYLKKGR